MGDWFLPFVSQVGIPAAVFGAVGSTVKDAVAAWYRSRQATHLERLRGDVSRENAASAGGVEHKVWVSRIQFETEFAALQKIWQSLAELRRALHAARPTFERVVDDKSFEDRLMERGNLLSAKFNELMNVADAVEPFVPIEVYEAAMDARLVARKEINEILIAVDGLHRGKEWWESAERHREAVNAALRRTADAIRDRLASLQIVADR